MGPTLRPATILVVMTVRLSKHHGLGNDFLVVLASQLPDDAAKRARRWCERRTGIGADGLIFGLLHNDTVKMRLFNSDGGEAEVSGNGLRCLAQAVARQHGVITLEIDVWTPAGRRHCTVKPGRAANTVTAIVDMGAVRPGPDPDTDDLIAAVGETVADVRCWTTGSVGNPHAVCEVDDPYAINLNKAGTGVESHFRGGINVHFVTVAGPNELLARVWERGAGVTGACGSGAVVMSDWFYRRGLVGPRVVVRMPGGDALVDLEESPTLSGPVVHVADIEMPDE